MIEFKGLQFAPDFTVKSEKNFAQAHNYIDNEVVKRLEDYTPISKKGGVTKSSHGKWVPFKRRGAMSKAHKVQTPGVIINTEPTARKEYYINKGFSGKLRGKFWLERMKADHKEEILKGVKGE